MCIRHLDLNYQHGLLYQSVAVFTHVLQDFVGCCLAGRNVRLGGHSKGVNQGLKYMLQFKHLESANSIINFIVYSNKAKNVVENA